MKPLSEYIKDLVENYFENDNFFLVDVTVSSNNIIVVYIDKLNGHIEVGECAKLSRYLENDLEENNLVGDKYKLDVSSPGLDNAFKVHKQYVKNIGRVLNVWNNENNKIEGLLKSVNNDEIVLEKKVKNKKKIELKEMKIAFNNIAKTKVKISFKN